MQSWLGPRNVYICRPCSPQTLSLVFTPRGSIGKGVKYSKYIITGQRNIYKAKDVLDINVNLWIIWIYRKRIGRGWPFSWKWFHQIHQLYLGVPHSLNIPQTYWLLGINIQWGGDQFWIPHLLWWVFLVSPSTTGMGYN